MTRAEIVDALADVMGLPARTDLVEAGVALLEREGLLRVPSAAPKAELIACGLTFAPETGPHAPRLRSSVFRSAAGRYVLRLVTETGAGGAAEYDTMDEALDVRPLYAELTGNRPPVRGSAADARREIAQ